VPHCYVFQSNRTKGKEKESFRGGGGGKEGLGGDQLPYCHNLKSVQDPGHEGAGGDRKGGGHRRGGGKGKKKKKKKKLKEKKGEET